MSNPTPPSISRLMLVGVGSFAFLIGGFVAASFYDVADLRDYVPPAFATWTSSACGDIDAYVRHVKSLNDHHVRTDSFGIHRQKTIDAVDELYDRARCDVHQDVSTGLETYKKLPPSWVVNSNDPPPRAPVVATAPITSVPAANPTTPLTSAPAATPTISHTYIANRHHRIVITDDGTLDAVQPAPAAEPPPCVIYKPGQVNYGQPAGCR